MSTLLSIRRITGVLVASVCAISPPGLLAQGASPSSIGRHFDDLFMDQVRRLPPADLKRLYLDCEGDSEKGGLGTGEIQACSVVYVELLQRVFGGDFDALLAWSRQQTAADADHELAADPAGSDVRP